MLKVHWQGSTIIVGVNENIVLKDLKNGVRFCPLSFMIVDQTALSEWVEHL